MKELLLLVLLFNTSAFSQTTFSQTSGNQLDYFNSNLNDLKDEKGNSIVNSVNNDSLVFNGETTSNYFGRNVSNAGDVNGDGYSDG